MTQPYLIAHLVRGEPAFDIAEQIDIGDEVGWIIPTSGHRAYPYWFASFNEVMLGGTQRIEVLSGTIPADHPDHYAASPAPRGQGIITNLASRLGLIVKQPTIRRR